jgi:hypothetical protein
MALLGQEQHLILIHPMHYKCITSAPVTNVRLLCCPPQLPLIVWAGCVTISILPDDVLLRVFFFDELKYQHTHGRGGIYLERLGGVDRQRRLPWMWHRLVHVCQRWRSVIFASPNFLGLRLVCLPGTRVELTGIWPPLTIFITNAYDKPMPEDYDFDAAIVHPNRVREISLFRLTGSQLQRLVNRMQEQFPSLIHLALGCEAYSSDAPALADGFLGGSTPHLQHLGLYSIPFPALPKFLLSATDLVQLSLMRIPHSGYISPEAIVTGLAAAAHLKSLIIEFRSPLSRPDRNRRRPPPPIRTVLPALTHFRYKGVSEYLEDLMARIDAPLLDTIRMIFFHQLIFNTPQLAQFMRRTTSLQALNEAHIDFNKFGIHVGYSPPTGTGERSRLKVSCREMDWQLSSMAQVFTSFFPSICMVEHLYMSETSYSLPQWQDDIDTTQWLEIFEPFTAVKNIYLTKAFAQHIAHALQELVGSEMIEVLPTLQNIFLEAYLPSGPPLEGIGKFIAARQLSDHPITVSLWERH